MPDLSTDAINPGGTQSWWPPMVAMAENGDAVMVWVEEREENNQTIKYMMAMEYRAAGNGHAWSSTINLGEPNYGLYLFRDQKLAMAANGDAVLVVRDRYDLNKTENRSEGGWTGFSRINESAEDVAEEAFDVAMDDAGNTWFQQRHHAVVAAPTHRFANDASHLFP